MDIAITFDTDWAPDWCIQLCHDLCTKHSASSTFFVTHKTDLMLDLNNDSKVETGIHPNFLAGSSHGETMQDVMRHVLALVPDAVSMRTHSLVQSSPILEHVVTSSAIRNDVSLFMPFTPMRQGSKMHFGEPKRVLRRLPYFWEDDTAAEWPGWDWGREPPINSSAAFLIFNFHPIHIGLNMADLAAYGRLKQSLAGRRLSDATPRDCAPFVNHGDGARSFLEKLLVATSDHTSHTIAGLADATTFPDPVTGS